MEDRFTKNFGIENKTTWQGEQNTKQYVALAFVHAITLHHTFQGSYGH